MKRTLYDKIWENHAVTHEHGESVLFVDWHLIHEVTSPQAFASLAARELPVLFPRRTIATTDHNVPTVINHDEVENLQAQAQIAQLQQNCRKNGIQVYDLESDYQGIVHVIAPEMGYIQPGMTVVCGDSHTSTHGALGALAFGIGTSEIEKVLATQAVNQKKSKNMLVKFNGTASSSVTAKDIVLHAIAALGVDGGTGYVIEYQGQVVDEMSIEGRMTLCNMCVEAGAKAGLIAPDSKTVEYLRDRIHSPNGEHWSRAVEHWRTLSSDSEAQFDKTVEVSVEGLGPQVTWGTNPSQVVGINDRVPHSGGESQQQRAGYASALAYMGLLGGELIRDIRVDVVFIGSCTNARIEDLRSAAQVINDRKCHEDVTAIVVPGSKLVARQAEKEGLRELFVNAGFEWRKPGCSMCVGINGDSLLPGMRSASTSNRNFEGRQGKGSMTHLVSPVVAAATAIAGHFSDH